MGARLRRVRPLRGRGRSRRRRTRRLGAVILDARLRISRLSGWARYRVLLDGEQVATLGRGESVELEVASGQHRLQLVSWFAPAGPDETFTVRAGETAAFACHAPSFVAAVPRLVLRRGSWIALDRTGHRETRDDGNPPEHQGELLEEIQAAQATQPGIRR